MVAQSTQKSINLLSSLHLKLGMGTHTRSIMAVAQPATLWIIFMKVETIHPVPIIQIFPFRVSRLRSAAADSVVAVVFTGKLNVG